METEPVHERVRLNNLKLLSALEQFTEYGFPVVLPYKEHNRTVVAACWSKPQLLAGILIYFEHPQNNYMLVLNNVSRCNFCLK
jgi:hypothetical protein